MPADEGGARGASIFISGIARADARDLRSVGFFSRGRLRGSFPHIVSDSVARAEYANEAITKRWPQGRMHDRSAPRLKGGPL
jgi:hypothetical protein